VAEFFRRPAIRQRTHADLEAAVRAAPLRPTLWAQLAALHEIGGDTAQAARCAERAAALERGQAASYRPIGRVLAAAVYHFVGKAKGLVHEVWAERHPTERGRGGFLAEVLGNVSAELTQGIRNTFVSVRGYARTKFPDRVADILDYNYTFKLPKEDEPSGGSSAGLPAALSFLSVFLQRWVPQDIAFSGTVIADAHDVLVVRRVGESEYKVKAAYNRNLRALVLPLENRGDIEADRQVPRAVSGELVKYVRTLNDALPLAFGEEIWVS
jgi:hypothetical protein